MALKFPVGKNAPPKTPAGMGRRENDGKFSLLRIFAGGKKKARVLENTEMGPVTQAATLAGTLKPKAKKAGGQFTLPLIGEKPIETLQIDCKLLIPLFNTKINDPVAKLSETKLSDHIKKPSIE